MLARWLLALLGFWLLHQAAGQTSSSGQASTAVYRTQAVTWEDVYGWSRSTSPVVGVVETTIAAVQKQFLTGGLTCSALVRAYTQRISAYDKNTGLNSVRALLPSLASVVAAKDAELARVRAANGTLPPLFCVPLLVKDNYDVVSLATNAGNAGLADNFPPADAFVVQKLQQQGAVVLGKANCGEFALEPAESVGSVYGAVRNPYNLDFSPAGSSGGSAAGVSANLGLVALGTDTGSSIRGPASHCGVVGLRPSLGIVSRTGVLPCRLTRDVTGPIGRTVEDVARVFQAMAGHDPADNLTSLALQSPPPANYTQFLRLDGLRGARLGVLRQISNQPEADPAVLALFGAALEDLAGAGATIVDNFKITGNSLGADWDAYQNGQGNAAGEWNVNGHWEDLWNCEAAFTYDLNAYLQQPNRTQHFRSLQALYGAGAYHPSVGDDLADAVAANYTPASYPPPYLRAQGYRCGCGDFYTDPCRSEFRKNLVDSMNRERVDAVLHPTWISQVLLLGDQTSPLGNVSPDIAPHTGTPAITVPMGQTSIGLPTGLTLLGRPFDEGTLLRLAYAYEHATRHRVVPPAFPELTAPPATSQAG